MSKIRSLGFCLSLLMLLAITYVPASAAITQPAATTFSFTLEADDETAESSAESDLNSDSNAVSNSNSDETAPKTGDSNKAILWLYLLLLSSLSLKALIRKKGKNQY